MTDVVPTEEELAQTPERVRAYLAQLRERENRVDALAAQCESIREKYAPLSELIQKMVETDQRIASPGEHIADVAVRILKEKHIVQPVLWSDFKTLLVKKLLSEVPEDRRMRETVESIVGAQTEVLANTWSLINLGLRSADKALNEYAQYRTAVRNIIETTHPTNHLIDYNTLKQMRSALLAELEKLEG